MTRPAQAGRLGRRGGREEGREGTEGKRDARTHSEGVTENRDSQEEEVQ